MWIRMPGESYRGPLPPLTADEMSLREELRRDVETLGGEIGERNLWRDDALAAAVEFIETSLAGTGLAVSRQPFTAQRFEFFNLEAAAPGLRRPGEILVVGAHYDSALGSPGANDNGTGVAATLALARRFARAPAARTLRFVAFANEEPPFFQTEAMGSAVYARACRARGDRIAAMISLETIGYYSDAPGSQQYPQPFGIFYPSTGNFIAVVSGVRSRDLTRRLVASFRARTKFPCEGGALPGWIPGIEWSDHWAFSREGYPAAMITDTAPFRYPHYHLASDTPGKIDYDRLARVVAGWERAIRELADDETGDSEPASVP